MNLLNELRSRFETALTPFAIDPAPFAAMVKPTQDAKFGDYQANCCMPLAKQRGENPRELAAKVVAALDVAEFCEPPEVAGAGFINLRVRPEWLQEQTNALIANTRLGVEPVAQPHHIVVDFSSPNVAKPMHVGHLRSTVIGDALCKILKFQGHHVISDNHVGDWGTQFGMIIYGYKHFLDQAALERDMVGELARLYRLVNQLCDYHDLKPKLPKLQEAVAEKQKTVTEAEGNTIPTDAKKADSLKKQLKKLREQLADAQADLESAQSKCAAVEGDATLKALADGHPKIVVESRLETSMLHAGERVNRELWQRFVPECLEAIQRMYDRLGVNFDHTLGESYYDPLLKSVVEEMQAKGLARESDGAVCVFNAGFEAPFIIRKRDGAFTYATTDLATIKYRVQEFQADLILYVVDSRQSEHFVQLFDTARQWGYTGVELQHVKFGTILGKDNRPYKTRSGDTVGLESLLDEGVANARRIVDANDDRKEGGPVLDEAARARVAEAVGLGAIKYADLSQNRESDYVFDWERMLATTGDTATYMQYAYARICGILRKGDVDREALRVDGKIVLEQPAERALAIKLLQFGEALDQASFEFRPNFLTAYLFEAANTFSTFYAKCDVLKAATPELRTSRLLLCDLTARMLQQGLGLLGVETIEQM